MIVARNFPEHDFLFVCPRPKADIIREEFPVEEIPGLETIIREDRVDFGATAANAARILLRQKHWLRKTLEIMDRFQPDVAITDLEFFTGLAGRKTGLPCLSLDHGHLLTRCVFPVALSQRLRYAVDSALIDWLYSRADYYLVTTFFFPPLKPNARTRLVAPILREKALEREPSDGDHILAFKSFSGFDHFLPLLRALRRPVIVYGYDMESVDGNLRFKRRSDDGFLDDMASSSYVICGGGHTVVSEALFYGKPVLSFPGYYFEQELSAYYLDQLSYGTYFKGKQPSADLFTRFESRLDHFRQSIPPNGFCGNREAFDFLGRFFSHKVLAP